jgi:hypothetical protein
MTANPESTKEKNSALDTGTHKHIHTLALLNQWKSRETGKVFSTVTDPPQHTDWASTPCAGTERTGRCRLGRAAQCLEAAPDSKSSRWRLRGRGSLGNGGRTRELLGGHSMWEAKVGPHHVWSLFLVSLLWELIPKFYSLLFLLLHLHFFSVFLSCRPSKCATL